MNVSLYNIVLQSYDNLRDKIRYLTKYKAESLVFSLICFCTFAAKKTILIMTEKVGGMFL